MVDQQKVEELKEKYREAMRAGDADRATEVWQELDEVRSDETESESEDSDYSESGAEQFTELKGVGPELAEEIAQKFDSVEEIAEDRETLVDVAGIGEETADELIEQVE